MKLADGVQQYVEWKRSNGYRFQRSAGTLRSFSNAFPGSELSQITSDAVLGFLNRNPLSTVTWRLKYWTLLRFFQYLFQRDKMAPFEMPLPKPVAKQLFMPYVFTVAELRALLQAITRSDNSRRRIDALTLRTAILFLYGTGASVGEIGTIRISDVNMIDRFVSIRSTRFSRARCIPIGEDLGSILKRLIDVRFSVSDRNSYLFVTKRGLQFSSTKLGRPFRRLRELAGVHRKDGSTYQPRVDDLRYTFAVHQIAKWIAEGADLNRMLPALAAYMGQIGLGATERYLFMTPERFRHNLDKLSPRHGRGMWCEKPELLRFLSRLSSECGPGPIS